MHDAAGAGAHAPPTGFFTTIRRTPDGKLQAVPYSLEYQGELARAAALLREAAALTQQPTLQRVPREARAAAFLSNDYYDSDVAWMELDASIEPTIGPYEVYEDELVQRKAAFEAFITRARRRRDREAGASSAGELQEIENNLPIDAEAAQPEARRAGADPRRQPAVLRRRRQQGGADRRLQPAQRRAHHQARWAASA